MTKKLLTALAVLSMGANVQSTPAFNNAAWSFGKMVAQNPAVQFGGLLATSGAATVTGMKSYVNYMTPEQPTRTEKLKDFARNAKTSLVNVPSATLAKTKELAGKVNVANLKDLAGKLKVSKKQAMVGAGALAVAGATVAAVKYANSRKTASNVTSTKSTVATSSFDDIVKSSNGNIMLVMQGLRTAGCTKANVEKINFSGFSKGNVAYIKSQLNA